MIPLLVKLNDVNLTLQYTTLHTMLIKQCFHVAVYLDSIFTLLFNFITNKYNNQEINYKLAIKTLETSSILFVLFWISFYNKYTVYNCAPYLCSIFADQLYIYFYTPLKHYN